MNCPLCQTENVTEANYCRQCGTDLSAQEFSQHDVTTAGLALILQLVNLAIVFFWAVSNLVFVHLPAWAGIHIGWAGVGTAIALPFTVAACVRAWTSPHAQSRLLALLALATLFFTWLVLVADLVLLVLHSEAI